MFHFMFVSWDLDLSIYVSMIKTSMVTREMVFVSSWILLAFGCAEWDFKLHWAKSNIRLRFNSPPNLCLCLVCKFEVLHLHASMSLWSTFSTGFVMGATWTYFLKNWIITLGYFEYPCLSRTNSTNDQETT